MAAAVVRGIELICLFAELECKRPIRFRKAYRSVSHTGYEGGF